MKMHSKLTVLGSLALLSTSPLALANKPAHSGTAIEAPADDVTDAIVTDPVVIEDGTTDAGGATDGIVDEGTVTDPIDDGAIDDGVTDDGTKDDGTTTDGEVVDPNVGEAGGEVTDPVTVEECIEDGTPVPLDWIKRGGENPDVMFYNMASGGPGVVFKGETSPVAKQIGPDERATAIEGKDNAGVSSLNREKKGPVALVKKGRVFLR